MGTSAGPGWLRLRARDGDVYIRAQVSSVREVGKYVLHVEQILSRRMPSCFVIHVDVQDVYLGRNM